MTIQSISLHHMKWSVGLLGESDQLVLYQQATVYSYF